MGLDDDQAFIDAVSEGILDKSEDVIFGIVDTDEGVRIALTFIGAKPVRWTPKAAKLVAETMLKLAQIAESMELKREKT